MLFFVGCESLETLSPYVESAQGEVVLSPTAQAIVGTGSSIANRVGNPIAMAVAATISSLLSIGASYLNNRRKENKDTEVIAGAIARSWEAEKPYSGSYKARKVHRVIDLAGDMVSSRIGRKIATRVGDKIVGKKKNGTS